jgi:hypothetical protein
VREKTKDRFGRNKSGVQQDSNAEGAIEIRRSM